MNFLTPHVPYSALHNTPVPNPLLHRDRITPRTRFAHSPAIARCRRHCRLRGGVQRGEDSGRPALYPPVAVDEAADSERLAGNRRKQLNRGSLHVLVRARSNRLTEPQPRSDTVRTAMERVERLRLARLSRTGLTG